MKYRILDRLRQCREGYVSGEVLAKELGITRTAVWKHIDALRKDGYQVEAVSNRGYRLVMQSGLPASSGEEGGRPHRFGRITYRFKEVDSTNDVAREMIARERLPEGAVVVADRQVQGRGRRGRKWESPQGGLWFSLVLYPDIQVAEAAKLSLVFASAVADGLRRFTPGRVQVKWPNDVLINNQKIAGILLEIKGEFDKIEYVVAGIGVNVNIPFQDIPLEIRSQATSLLIESGREFPLDKVLNQLLACMEEAYDSFLSSGWTRFRRKFVTDCQHYGKRITVRVGGEVWSGLDLGVDDWGCLRLKLDDGSIHRIPAGDVILE